jgi:hypothetical protein
LTICRRPRPNNPSVHDLIHDFDYKDQIGLEMKSKGDPADALKNLREVDAAAKAWDDMMSSGRARR